MAFLYTFCPEKIRSIFFGGGVKNWGFFRASCFGYRVKGVCPLLLPLVSLIWTQLWRPLIHYVIHKALEYKYIVVNFSTYNNLKLFQYTLVECDIFVSQFLAQTDVEYLKFLKFRNFVIHCLKLKNYFYITGIKVIFGGIASVKTFSEKT